MHDDPEPSVDIPESDEELLAQCRVDTFRAGGKGGQHQNVTESGVRLVHLPTGVRATARNERSQHRNKSLAIERLRRKLEKRNERPPARVSTGVPRAEKVRRRERKRRRARVKSLRKKPPADEE
jgi:protein subunit release factor A